MISSSFSLIKGFNKSVFSIQIGAVPAISKDGNRK
jgi:hypothetical protein